MNTAAVQKNMVDAIALKKTEFDTNEAVEGALWVSIESAQQDGSDFTELQKRHKAVVKVLNGIAKYFDKYTEPTNDPAALSSDATSASSTALDQRETAAFVGDTAMDLRPAALRGYRAMFTEALPPPKQTNKKTPSRHASAALLFPSSFVFPVWSDRVVV
jgi:hypothetical protein